MPAYGAGVEGHEGLTAARVIVADGPELSPDDITDEAAARAARTRYREEGLPVLPADAGVAPHLMSGEQVLGWRPEASLGRVDEATHVLAHDGGPAYVTSHRLLHLGHAITAVPLGDIAEVAMAGDRILVTIAGSRGLMLDLAGPRQFRVLLAAARAAAAGG